MRESTQSIGEWASATFGDAGSDARVAARANEEMSELLRAATSGRPAEHLVVEAADVVIILARLAYRNGFDLWEEVEKKMAINRARVWKQDGTGHGYHVRDKSSSLTVLTEIVGSLNVCSDNPNVPDDFLVPVDMTMGELRKARAAIAQAKGEAA
ncbi:hypothetical protein [Sphingobium cupriresistens]|uniref:hypothetical protein n=1 Tax=Sphingobium cupriresistens TaxID=1132417 RepID=UPI003BADF09D